MGSRSTPQRLVSAIPAAANHLKELRDGVRQAFSPRPEDTRTLTKEQQLHQFLSMTTEEADSLVRRRGPAAFQEYAKAMLDLMQGGG